MDNYNNGPIPPYQNNNSGYPPYYTPPTRHPGSSFATASMILGIIAIISAFFGTVYPPIICGGLAVILGLLSKGNDKAMLPNAKVGGAHRYSGNSSQCACCGKRYYYAFYQPFL